jgi:hypothetical protein
MAAMTSPMRLTARRGAALAVLAAATLAGACSSDKLLEARDPDIVNPSDVQNPEGADAARVGAFSRFTTALTLGDAGGEGYFLMSGLLADEYRNLNSFDQTRDIDARATTKIGTVTTNSAVEQNYRNLARARTAADVAINMMRQFRPTLTSQIAQMYLLRGYTELYMAEGYCSGLSFGSAAGSEITYGEQLTTEQALRVAQATLDTALQLLGTATDTIATRVRPAAQIGRGRVLLGRNLYDSAAVAVSGVPTAYAGFSLTFAQASGDNGIWALVNNQRRYGVGDSVDYALQGGRVQVVGRTLNAVPFITAADPRVQTQVTTGAAFVTTFPTQNQLVFPTRESTVPIATGVDARLIEAEAALARGNSAAYLPILNTLRSTQAPAAPATVANVAPGAPTAYVNVRAQALTDPGTAAGRVTQFFREAAFWQFGRGYRLGNLRRMVRQYQRPQESVYPSGTNFYTGAPYGTDVVLPLPTAEQNGRAAFQGCFDFNA